MRLLRGWQANWAAGECLRELHEQRVTIPGKGISSCASSQSKGNDMNEKLDLLPCPHCGARADFNNDGDCWDQVICGGCGCRGCEYPNSREKAAAAWNRRSWKNLDRILDVLQAAGCCKDGRVHAPEDVVANAIRDWLSSAQRLEPAKTADDNELRAALLDLLHVSFPPVGGGADVDEYLTSKHNEAVRRGCELLGIEPHPRSP